MKFSDIKSVKRIELDGLTYCWFVKIGNGFREFGNADKSEYSIERLPKKIQLFIAMRTEHQILNESGYAEYLIF